MSEVKVSAIILAAGSGSRMNSDVTKQRIEILGKTVLYRSASAFAECADVDEIVVVTRPDELDFVRGELLEVSKVKAIVPGGKTRAESARFGFKAASREAEFVAIHDAARCLIQPHEISRVINDAKKYGAATASAKIFDTVKRIDAEGLIIKTENREELAVAQTPQIFRRDIYEAALDFSDSHGASVTDDNMMVEMLGVKVYATDIGRENVKITRQEDLGYAEYVVLRREGNG